MHIRIELNRGFGWQVRQAGPAPAGTTMDAVKDHAMRCALNGPVRAFVDGDLVFEHGKLTKKQAKSLFGV